MQYVNVHIYHLMLVRAIMQYGNLYTSIFPCMFPQCYVFELHGVFVLLLPNGYGVDCIEFKSSLPFLLQWSYWTGGCVQVPLPLCRADTSWLF